MNIRPVVLEGEWIRLEPLGMQHLPALCEIGLEPALWRWIPTPVHSAAEMRRYVETALEDQSKGTELPFAIIERASGRVIGTTRYLTILPRHRRLEIGATWLALAHQRTRANTETKLLLLTHAFEALNASRVELKTDALNEKSRNAIRRLGAVEEGVLRSHIITASGRVRDTVYFSILESEWPAVKQRLTALLHGGRRAPPA